MSDLSTLQMRLPEIRMAASNVAPDDLTPWSASERTRFARELHWCIDKLQELELRLQAGHSNAGRRRRPF